MRRALWAVLASALLLSVSALPVAMVGGGSAAGTHATASVVAQAAQAAQASPSPSPSPTAPPVGPPYPPRVAGRTVYDYAGIFSAETIARTEAAIERIRAKTGSEVVIYTQVKPGATTPSTEGDARALLEQWGVGGPGVGNGLVILWNLDETLKHGQVQLYAGAAFQRLVPDAQRQAIFDDDMLPLLRKGDLDGGMLVAMERLQTLLGIGVLPESPEPVTWTAKVGPAGRNGIATLTATGNAGTVKLALKGLSRSTAYPVKIVKGTCAKPGSVLWAAPTQTSTSAGKIAKNLVVPAPKVAVIRTASSAGPIAIRVGSGSRLRCGLFTGGPAPTFTVLDTLGAATPDTVFSVYGSFAHNILSWQNVGPAFTVAQATVITEIGGFLTSNSAPLLVQIRPSVAGAPSTSSVLATFVLSRHAIPSAIAYESVAPDFLLPAGSYFAMFAPQNEDEGGLLTGASDPFAYLGGLAPMGFLDPSSGTSSASPGMYQAVRILGRVPSVPTCSAACSRP